MTIDEAIKHCEEVAEHNEYLHKRGYAGGCNSHDCLERAEIHRQLAEWLRELKEAKLLLKLAVEDMYIEDMCEVCIKRIPNSPIRCPDGSNCFAWRYKDEALKLIGGSENG